MSCFCRKGIQVEVSAEDAQGTADGHIQAASGEGGDAGKVRCGMYAACIGDGKSCRFAETAQNPDQFLLDPAAFSFDIRRMDEEIDLFPAIDQKRILFLHIPPYAEPTLRDYFNDSDRIGISVWDFDLDYTEMLDTAHPLEALADKMLSLNEQLQEKRSRFLRRLAEDYEGVKTTTALQTFDKLTFAEFVAELKKQKIKLSFTQRDDLEPNFNDYAQACNTLSQQISETDKEIDTRVFDLYGLTPEEREIVMKG